MMLTKLMGWIVCVVIVAGVATAAPSNTPPTVRNITAEVDESRGQVTFYFAIDDPDDDNVSVWLRVSDDGRETYRVPVDRVEGDVGYPVIASDFKKLTWYYDPVTVPTTFTAKIIADDLYTIDPGDVIAGVDSTRLRGDIEVLEGVRHYGANRANINAAKDYIEAEFNGHGVQASRQPFNYIWRAENVIGRWPGVTDEEAVYIVDGHFDTIGSTPGADDNASGTAGMLEAMRVLSQYHFDKSIKFIGFDLEESGLVGSGRYVQAGIPAYERTEGVFNFEMIGYTCRTPNCDAFEPVGDYIHNISDVQSNSLRFEFDRVAALYVPELSIVSTEANPSNPNFRRSDHARFWDAGIKALFLTDGANFRNPHYHRSTDRVGTLDFTFMTRIVMTTVATVAELAGIRHVGVEVSEPFTIGGGVTPVEHKTWGDIKQGHR